VLVDRVLTKTLGVEKSLRGKHNPYDRTRVEATFKSIRTKFVYGMYFLANKY